MPAIFLISAYLYILICLAILYILLFGNSSLHKNGIIGSLHRFLRRLCCFGTPADESDISDATSTSDKCSTSTSGSTSSKSKKQSSCLPAFITSSYSRIESYLCYSKNPLMQLLYLSLLTINASYFFYSVFFKLHEAPGVAYYVHYVMGPIVLITAVGSFFAASYSNPGIITKANHKHFAKLYTHNVCYPADRICHTCKIPKPARSKHCSLTGRCVSRFDHFCPWINNAIGEWNYRYFHMFLLSNCIMAWYGTYIIVTYLWHVAARDQLWSARFMSPSGTPIEASPAIVLQYMLMQYMWSLAQILFGVCIGLMLFLFWGYHFVRMVLFNTTTNETFKMSEVEDWLEALKMDPKCFDDEWDELLPFQRYQVTELKRMIAKKESLTNPYYISLWDNVMEVVSPPSLRNGAFKKSKFAKDE